MFFDVGTCVAERLLYLPNVGFCFLVCLGSCRICTAAGNNKGRYIAIWALTSVIAAALARSHTRSFDWLNEETLFESAYSFYLDCRLAALIAFVV